MWSWICTSGLDALFLAVLLWKRWEKEHLFIHGLQTRGKNDSIQSNLRAQDQNIHCCLDSSNADRLLTEGAVFEICPPFPSPRITCLDIPDGAVLAAGGDQGHCQDRIPERPVCAGEVYRSHRTRTGPEEAATATVQAPMGRGSLHQVISSRRQTSRRTGRET